MFDKTLLTIEPIIRSTRIRAGMMQPLGEDGRLLQDFPRLWSLANLEEQRKLLVSMLDAVYIDTKNNLIVAVKPKPPFRPVFQVAASRDGSEIRILNEPLKDSSVFLVETGESRTTPETMLCFV